MNMGLYIKDLNFASKDDCVLFSLLHGWKRYGRHLSDDAETADKLAHHLLI